MTRSVGEGTRVPLAGVDPCNAPGAVRSGLPQKLRTSLTLIEDNNAHVFREPPGALFVGGVRPGEARPTELLVVFNPHSYYVAAAANRSIRIPRRFCRRRRRGCGPGGRE